MEPQASIKVERGTPTAEELAALVGVLFSRPTPASPVAPTGSRWARHGRPQPLWGTGSDAWRAAALPR